MAGGIYFCDTGIRNYVIGDWRVMDSRDPAEVDLVEESADGLKAFEIKWNPKKAAEPLPRTFTNAYPSAKTFGISPDNVFEFLVG